MGLWEGKVVNTSLVSRDQAEQRRTCHSSCDGLAELKVRWRICTICGSVGWKHGHWGCKPTDLSTR